MSGYDEKKKVHGMDHYLKKKKRGKKIMWKGIVVPLDE